METTVKKYTHIIQVQSTFHGALPDVNNLLKIDFRERKWDHKYRIILEKNWSFMKCPDECFNGEGGFPGMCQVCESVFTIEKRISEILLLSENRK